MGGDEEKMVCVDVYADTTGQYSDEEVFRCNCARVMIPERIVRQWYEKNFGKEEKLYFCGDSYINTFDTWLREVYTCDDTDGLYNYSVTCGYTPICGRNCDDWFWY